jgi:hypothetical protein
MAYYHRVEPARHSGRKKTRTQRHTISPLQRRTVAWPGELGRSRRLPRSPLPSRGTRRLGGVLALGVGKPSIRVLGQTAKDLGLQVGRYVAPVAGPPRRTGVVRIQPRSRGFPAQRVLGPPLTAGEQGWRKLVFSPVDGTSRRHGLQPPELRLKPSRTVGCRSGGGSGLVFLETKNPSQPPRSRANSSAGVREGRVS